MSSGTDATKMIEKRTLFDILKRMGNIKKICFLTLFNTSSMMYDVTCSSLSLAIIAISPIVLRYIQQTAMPLHQ